MSTRNRSTLRSKNEERRGRKGRVGAASKPLRVVTELEGEDIGVVGFGRHGTKLNEIGGGFRFEQGGQRARPFRVF